MPENKEHYVRSKHKFYGLPFAAVLCLLQISALFFRFSSNYPNITAALYIVFLMFLSMLTIISYLLFLAQITKKRKLIEVSNSYVFWGTNRIHVSRIDTVNLLSNSGIEINSDGQTFGSFHITNNREITDAILKQKKVFLCEI